MKSGLYKQAQTICDRLIVIGNDKNNQKTLFQLLSSFGLHDTHEDYYTLLGMISHILAERHYEIKLQDRFQLVDYTSAEYDLYLDSLRKDNN